jgi:integrase
MTVWPMAKQNGSSPAGDNGFVTTVKKGSSVVRIYPIKNRGKTIFTVTWFIGGKRQRRNFSDATAARREANFIAGKLNMGEAQILTLKATERESYLHAKELLTPLGIPLHDAIRDYVAARRCLKEEPLLPAVQFYLRRAHQRLPQKSVEQVVSEFRRIRKDDGRSERYLQDIDSRLGRFAKAFRMNIADVQTSMMDEWIRSLKVSARSRKNFRILLVALFNFAKTCGCLPKDATTAADALPAPKIEGKETEIYSPTEMRRLLQHSDENTLPIICLGAFAGLRTAEIERLNWEDIKWGQKVVEVRAKASKTGQRRLVPILPPLRSFLMPFAQCRGLVMPHVKIHERLRELAKVTGVKRKHNALRHSFASYRLASIKNAAQVALELGNSPRMVFQHYLELVTDAEGAKWWGLTPITTGKIIPITAAAQ